MNSLYYRVLDLMFGFSFNLMFAGRYVNHIGLSFAYGSFHLGEPRESESLVVMSETHN